MTPGPAVTSGPAGLSGPGVSLRSAAGPEVGGSAVASGRLRGW